MAENLDRLRPPAPDGAVVHDFDSPIHPRGIVVLRGSLAPEGAVVKIAGADIDRFEGAARVFDGEEAAMEAILAGSIAPGTVLVIRYEGPKGGPGMREMLSITGALVGAGRDKRLRARHRRPLLRGTQGFCIGHVAPEAVVGGPIALVADGDRVVIDAVAGSIDLDVDAGELARRRGRWSPPTARYTAGVLAKYARLVTGAERGAVTEP